MSNTWSAKASDVKPCPFCGSNDHVYTIKRPMVNEATQKVESIFQLFCRNEACSMLVSTAPDRDLAVVRIAWNTRATPPQEPPAETLADLPIEEMYNA